MSGFFTKEELGISVIDDCSKCKLSNGCVTPKMKPTGDGRKGILVIAEAPGKTEDEKGVQLIGQAGQVLRNVLKRQGIDLDEDCWKTNAVCCRPPKNRTPAKREINCCKPRMIQIIKEKNPRLVLLLGGVALESLLSTRIGTEIGGINKWRGFHIPDQEYKTWVCPTFHPSFILRSKGDIVIENIFNKDIERALKKLNKKIVEHKQQVEILDDSRANNLCQQLLDFPPELLSFDYETTGLKPYRKGHKIVCCGVSFKKGEAWAFKLENEKVIKYWTEILKNKHIPKTAHNMKFEHQWSRNVLGVNVRGWVLDTMIASHIIDNRSGVTGLKFQAYANFGIGDYSSHISKYLQSDNGEGFNRIEEADQEELFKYCGMDALLQYKLAKRQIAKKEIE